MGKGHKLFACNPSRSATWHEIASFHEKELGSVTAYTLSPNGDKLILISPVKPALHTTIRDAIEEGHPVTVALAPFEALSSQVVRDSYEVSRGALTALVNTLRQRSPTEVAALETFIARIMEQRSNP
jgi:hypothetical protein